MASQRALPKLIFPDSACQVGAYSWSLALSSREFCSRCCVQPSYWCGPWRRLLHYHHGPRQCSMDHQWKS